MNDFELVKDKLPISSVAVRYGSTMNRRFANPSPCCGHNDCCAVDDGKRLFKCHSCEAAGSVIDMVMAVDRCDETEALRKCADLAGMELKTYAKAAQEEERKPRESIPERMYRLAAEHYEAAMDAEGCPGKEWFCGARGHKEETLRKLRVGWATGRLIPYLQEHGFTPAEIVKCGLATDTVKTKGEDGREMEKSVPPFDYYGHDVAIFPVIDHVGKVISFTAKDPAKVRKASVMRGTVKKWFLNYPALGRYSDLFVVEGENDLASLMDSGFDNVIGTAGSPCQEQIVLLRNFCAGKTLYLWFDKDPDKDPRKNEGGSHHTRFIYQGLRGHNIDVRIISHPGQSKDPDDYIRGGFSA